MALDLFVPLDVNFPDDPKIIAAGSAGEQVYLRSLALAKRRLADGRIDATQLEDLCRRIKCRPSDVAARLVEVGLWDDVDGGWTISAWCKWNKSSAAVREKAQRKREISAEGNHKRWHVGEGKEPSESCPLCFPLGVPQGERSESTESETEEKTESETEAAAADGSPVRNGRRWAPEHPAAAASQVDLTQVTYSATLALAVQVRFVRSSSNITDDVPWLTKVRGELEKAHRANWLDLIATDLEVLEANTGTSQPLPRARVRQLVADAIRVPIDKVTEIDIRWRTEGGRAA